MRAVTGRLGLLAVSVGWPHAVKQERMRIHAARPGDLGDHRTLCGLWNGRIFRKRYKSLSTTHAPEVRAMGYHFCRECMSAAKDVQP